ncbi:16S rRNA (cytosine(967)-C(5))-methyltransferase RsmB [Comamonadaceae bacterium M7527]|nr:16S rRNA (cytosine(967)-C(5))-methyltransferase RsmB [Comamonadaceae bacterium M7527]
MTVTQPSQTLANQLPWVAACVKAVAGGRNVDTALAKAPAELRAGVQAIAYEVLRNWAWAQALLPMVAKKKPPEPARSMLLAAMALLRQPSNYVSHAVVDQAVSACKASHKLKNAAGFVNATLRTVLRDYVALDQQATSDWVVAYNHPIWWIKRLRAQYPDHWQTVLQANMQAAPMVLRVNLQRNTQQAYLDKLANAGIPATALGHSGVLLGKAQAVGKLPGFDAGDVSVQDGSPQLAALLLWASPHLKALASQPAVRAIKLLDACAAPGGKTAHLLEASPARPSSSQFTSQSTKQSKQMLELTALEIDATRATRITQTLERLGLSAQVVVADAALPGDWCNSGPFDAILLDAPCTASGIVRRHPDVPWLRRETDIAQLVAQQRALLEALWPQLAPGGRMVYCTCSTFKEEGQWQIEAFLARHADAKLQPSVSHILPADVDGALASQAHLAIGHNEAMGFDGFFYAVLDKAL